MKGPNLWWLSILLTSTVFVAGCSDDDDDGGGGGPPVDEPPTASFTFECTELTCNFTDASSDDGTLATWAWDFGDGTTSDVQTPPAVTYAAAGDYEVTLTVTDDADQTDSDTQTVSVTVEGGAPTAAFSFTCEDLTCTFTDESTDVGEGTIETYAWDFGDGTTSDVAAPPAVTYAEAGSYTVSLTVTDNDGETGTAESTVQVPALANDASAIMIDLDPAEIVVTGADPFSVTFSVMTMGEDGAAGPPLGGIEKVALYVMNQTANESDPIMGAPFIWTSHTQANGAGSSMSCTLTGKDTDRSGNEFDACTLVEDEANPGTYTGTWENEGTAPVVLDPGSPDALHRVIVRVYGLVDGTGAGLSDKVLSAPIDFVPSGGAAENQKDTVANASCIGCHGALDGYPEGDERFAYVDTHKNYQKVENCVACHTAALGEADFPALVHSLHIGSNSYPAEAFNCLTCHSNEAGQDSWTTIYGAACESCHTDFRAIAPHSETTGDDTCLLCHDEGGIAPTSTAAHVPTRRDDVAAAGALEFVFDSVTVTDDGDGTGTLTVVSTVTLDGAPVPDDYDFQPIMTNTGRGLLIGNVDANGFVTRGATFGMNVLLTDVDTSDPPDGVGDGNVESIAGGVMTTSRSGIDLAELAGVIYVTAEVQFCADKATFATAACEDGSLGYANLAPIAYFDLGDGTAPVTDAPPLTDTALFSRHSQPERVSSSEATCNTCHGNLTHVKGTHGVTEFTQCQACHNTTWAGSFHPSVNLVTGEGEFTAVDGLSFLNRDLTTVAHRYHSGNWDSESPEGLYLDGEGALQGYSSDLNDCTACHDDVAFADDGGLLSGKRSVAESDGTNTYFVSPVAAACRSCHTSDEAQAHMAEVGATFFEDANTDPALAIESCSSCHAEGSPIAGIDQVHKRPPVEDQDEEQLD